MDDTFFLHPTESWQRRYEALRASLLERLPAEVVAQRFGFSTSYVYLLRHQFRKGLLTFDGPTPPGKSVRRRVTRAIREKIREGRERGLSAGDIAEWLEGDGIELSVRTVERVLREEGFPKLPRRTQLKVGVTRQGALVPQKARRLEAGEALGRTISCEDAGVFLFLPWIERLGLPELVAKAGLPGSKPIAALSYFLSFLGLKLLGTNGSATWATTASMKEWGCWPDSMSCLSVRPCPPIRTPWTKGASMDSGKPSSKRAANSASTTRRSSTSTFTPYRIMAMNPCSKPTGPAPKAKH